MKNSMSFYVVLVLICFSFMGIASAEDISIAVRANKGNAKALAKWQATADYLSKKIPGYHFVLTPFENNSALNQAVSLGHFHFCITNPASGVEHKIRYGAKPLATLVNKRQGKGYSKFGSVIFTRADREDVNTLNDLKGKMFIGVDELGFGGWRIAWLELLNNGINPYRDFTELRFAVGKQQEVVYEVRDKLVAAGSVRTDTLERMAASGEINLSDYKILAKKKTEGFPFMHSTRLYPEWMFSSVKKFDDNLVSQVVEALFSIQPSSEAAINGKYISWISPLDYSSVDDLLKELNVGPYNISTMVGFQRLMTQYGVFLFFVILAFVLLMLAFLYVIKLNKNIVLAKESLKNEIDVRSKLERQLLHSQRIESLGQLTGGIAHDFNNMLASILGFTELALYSEAAQKDEKIKEYLNQVIVAAEKSSALVSQMLAFSREATDSDKKEIMSVSSLVNETDKLLQPIIPSNLTFTIKNIDKDLFVNENPGIMKQVLMKLFLNSKDAAVGEHGKITLNAKAVSYHGLDVYCDSCHEVIRGDFIEISIDDNGSGVEANIVEHMFDPFFTTKEVGKGTGMGLSMVHGIIHKSQGHILVQSEVDKGTCIKILVPKVIQEISETPVNKSNERLTTDSIKHIMIVDDERAITLYLSEVLRHHGFKVTAFNSSEDALSYFSENLKDIDLIITDQIMPNLTGAELAVKIQAYSVDTPIILCSGHSENERVKSIENIKAYIGKPLESNKLLSMINSLLELS